MATIIPGAPATHVQETGTVHLLEMLELLAFPMILQHFRKPFTMQGNRSPRATGGHAGNQGFPNVFLQLWQEPYSGTAAYAVYRIHFVPA